ncbi:MAG TPA: IPT/TIG domain-containing protein [Candidatus Acidoferrum sp.]|nr:IPT/TIG domain-containing protein [Candidatus Acidoferrum sp.]
MRRNFMILLSLLACLQAGCARVSGSHPSPTPPTAPPNPPSSGNIQVSVTPNPSNVRAASSQQFAASVTGTTNTAVTWSVNSISGGNSTIGTISSSGNYTAPASLPNPNTVTIQAISTADASASGSSIVNLLNPTPVLTSIQPTSINVGPLSLTVNGSNFLSGSQVLLAGVPLTTSFVSATQLTATGTTSTVGVFAVTVSNPNPGQSTSSGINLQVTSTTQASACSGMAVGAGASLNGFRPFPASNAWNQDISAAAVDPNSDSYINFIGTTVPLHPDFGSGEYQGSYMGIPYTVVDASQSPVNILYNAYGDESDPGPMPIPANANIEGYPNPGTGDRHVLVLDNSNCWLYELYGSSVNTDGTWNAGSAAVWDLQNYNQRPLTWTSADAAGLSIFPGLVRYDEVASGQIAHAIRFTLQNSVAAFVLPATHWAANSTAQFAAPMGMRLRLKSSFDISSFSATNQVILTALKQYGMIMADNGSSMYITGTPDDNWNNDDLHNLTTLTASDFEVVALGTVYTSANVPQGSAPTISSFTTSTANPVTAGTAVTLSWSATGASYYIVSPQIGAIRGSTAVVTPSATTTYTLYATNEFGRTTATVTVTVQ